MTQTVGLPPIYAMTPVELATHQIVASFPANTFLENLVIATDGTLLITSHEAGQITADNQPGEPAVFVTPTNIDDFAFDTDGNLYAATHIYNSVLRISPTGATTTIAQVEQGVIGSTAVAFGRSAEDVTSIYVVTNGGMFLPPPGGVVPANVVRIEVGKLGHFFSVRREE